MLILIRGLPGSGKNTFARESFSWCKHFEADDFWKGREFDARFLIEDFEGEIYV